MYQNQANKILSELESGYDQMAQKFSETRKFFWRDLEFVADYIKNGDKILDFGCGNGRILEILENKNISYIGADISGKLIKLAKDKYQGENIKFQKISGQASLSHTKFSKLMLSEQECDKGNLSEKNLVRDKPFPDEYFDVVISIAVFHHFPPEYAQKMAGELYRVAKTGGKIILTVWNLEQEKYRKYLSKNGEGYIPFKNNSGEIFNRYHHLYTKKSLEEMFFKAGFKILKSEVINGKNILLIGEK